MKTSHTKETKVMKQILLSTLAFLLSTLAARGDDKIVRDPNTGAIIATISQSATSATSASAMARIRTDFQ